MLISLQNLPIYTMTQKFHTLERSLTNSPKAFIAKPLFTQIPYLVNSLGDYNKDSLPFKVKHRLIKAN